MHMPHSSLALPCACTSLREAARAVSRIYDDALSETGLTTTQYSILRALARNGDAPLSRLADTLVMDRTSLYRTLAPMARHGWIDIQGTGHGRTKLACLTATGREAMEKATSQWEMAQARLVGALGPEAWASLQASLNDVVAIATGPRK